MPADIAIAPVRSEAILAKFLIAARQIVDIAADEVHERLRSLTGRDLAAFSAQERRSLLAVKMTDAEKDELAQRLTRSFEEGRVGLQLLLNAALREVAIFEIKHAIVPFSTLSGEDPVAFYTAKYEPLFERIGLPRRALRFIDGNLSVNLPPLADRETPPRPARGRAPRLRERELGR